ncbi:hypothetical protein TNCT_732891 [Trichonephila clavata]|uniref:Uncharacterized protein n=1 Tax=Trichonephila clavata TaxID=2740835 RepID=A0A8X6IZD3_TRICU|nr:hypothetical protein TNCT_732891 [Trichonephila clavata]
MELTQREEDVMIRKLFDLQCFYVNKASVASPTMGLSEEIVQQISQSEIAFKRCCQVKSCCDALREKEKCLPARVCLWQM